jgi:two-component system, OmpR family, sensor kinase
MSSVRTRLSRLPLRVRLVAGFSVAMLVVLLAAGSFVYWRVDYALDRGLDTELAQAIRALTPLVGTDGHVANRPAAEATGVAWQILDASGTVLDHGGPAGPSAMVDSRQLAQVASRSQTFNAGGILSRSPEPYRLRVTRLSSSPPRYLLAGVRRDHRDEALRELLGQLALAGLGALLVTAVVGERLSRAALRPVERYRRRAAAIAEGAHDLRIDVPTLRDDEVTRLGHTLNDMLVALERAVDRERQFVNEASHELRTPVTLLSGRIQLARRRPRTQLEHERVLDELQVDVDRLARLAEQLLQVAGVRARTGNQECDLAVVTARVAGQRRLGAPAPDSDLAVDLPSLAVPVAAADYEIDRLLTNVLDNAETHGAAPYVVIVDSPSPSWARLSVSDGGPGMPPDLLETATRRFARSRDARSRPGAGLGLALVQALVAEIGGELRLCHHGHHVSHGHRVPVVCAHDSEMTVTILVPARHEGPAGEAESAEQAAAAGPAGPDSPGDR